MNSESFSTAAGFFSAFGGGLLWLLFGYPAKCADDLTGQRLPGLADALGQSCEEVTVIGVAPIFATESQAIFIGLVFAGICFVIGGYLAARESPRA